MFNNKLFYSFIVVILVTTIAFGGLFLRGNDKLDLKFNPQEGYKYHQEFTIWQKATRKTTPVNFDQTPSLETARTIGIEMKVAKGKNPDEFTLIGDVDYFSFMQSFGSDIMNYNSRNEHNDVPPHLARLYDGILKMQYTGQYDRLGKILNQKWSIKRPSHSENRITYFQEARLINEASYMLCIADFDFYPDHPVSIGDSWTKTKIDQKNIQTDVTYTLVARSEGIATIELSANIDQLIKKEDQAVTYFGAGRGEMKIDEKTGIANSLALEMTVNIQTENENKPATESISEIKLTLTNR